MPLMVKEELDGGAIYTGARGDYRWLTSTEQYMGALVQHCPEVLLRRYLVVTAVDSGTPWLTDRQRAGGWELRSGMAYSREISSIDELFYQRDGDDVPGYDEWYFFSTPPSHLGEIFNGNPFVPENKPRPGKLIVFVGWAAFVLHETTGADTINEMFWQQLDWVRPDFYVSDGRDNLTFVSKHEEVFDLVYERLRSALET